MQLVPNYIIIYCYKYLRLIVITIKYLLYVHISYLIFSQFCIDLYLYR